MIRGNHIRNSWFSRSSSNQDEFEFQNVDFSGGRNTRVPTVDENP